MDKLNTRKYELLLAMVIASRATSFIFSKMILKELSPFNLLAVRFLIAFCFLVILFHKELFQKMTKQTLGAGVVIGILFFLTMSFEMLALEQANSSLVSLLENCAIIFVPILELVLFRKFPSRITVCSTLTAMVGVVFLAIQQGNLSGGFSFGLLAGLSYAFAIIVTDKLSHKIESALCVGIIQVGTMGLLAGTATLLFEQPKLPQSATQWLMIGVLIVVCTGFGFTLQPVAQKYVTAQRAGLFCAISPAIAAILGVVVLREKIGVLGTIGLLLILTSIVLPYLKKESLDKT